MSIIKVAIDGNNLLPVDVEEYVKAVLPAEMPSRWHEEALKAQSIAIRTYSLAKMAQRGFVYADTRDQVFNPAKRTIQTDAIVETTKGIVGIYKGQIIATFYHAACGGSTLDDWANYLRATICPCDQPQAGHRMGMCQYGAQALAEQGRNWQEILDFYYKDINWEGNYGRMIMSKLNPHFQKIPDWAKPLWANCKNEWYKVVIPPIGDPFPGKKGIGRPWIGGDHVENGYIRDGAAGAERYFARLKDYYLMRPYIWAWESPNEPHPMGDAAFRAKLNEFLVRWVELMHGIQKLTVILCLSVGWPDQPEDILDFVDALALTDYWALHEYSAPTMQDAAGWHCLRYRQTIQALRDAGHRIPPLLVTECGIDGGVLSPPQGKTGWKTHARDEDDFMGQLAWYDRELCQDDYVKAFFRFTSGAESEWLNFDDTESLTRKQVNHINSSSPLPVEPPVNGPTDDEIRNLAYNSLGVPYTPTHAFPLYAKKHNLGAPLRDTFDHKGFRIQPFMGGIVICPIDQWNKVSHISW